MAALSSYHSRTKKIRTALFPPRLQRVLVLLGLCTLGTAGSEANADSAVIRPLYNVNQSPLIQIYGLPPLDSARVLPSGESTLDVAVHIANNFTGSSNGGESLTLDGETRRLSLVWRQGLSGGKEWGVELPYVTQSGGFLDRSIEEFHNIFGLPQHGRTDLPRNRIDYRYARDGVQLLSLTHAASGPGDVRLFAGKNVENTSGNYTAAWRASLKLPTGDEAQLLGSGSTDLAVWLSAATTKPKNDWNWYGGGGLLLMTNGDVLPTIQRNHAVFGSLGVGKSFFPQVTIKGGLEVHSPFYSGSGLRQLGRYTVVGLLGVDWEFAPRKFIEFSMSEDIVVGASPDVAFNLSLNLPFP